MKRIKKLSVFLAVIGLLFGICIGAEAAYSVSGTVKSQEGYDINYICQNNEDSYRILDITGKGAMIDYYTSTCFGPVSPWTYDADQWMTYSYGINIGEGITHIGSYAFDDFYNLYEVTLPETLKSIGDWAFYDSCYLTSINIPDSVVSIGEGAFYSCSSRLTVTCSSTSYAYQYAMENGFQVNLTDKCSHTSYKTETTAAGCTTVGKTVKTCNSCGEIISTETIAPVGHTWETNGTMIKSATVFSKAVYEYKCKNCDETIKKTEGSYLKAVLNLNAAKLTIGKKQTYTKLKATSMAKGDSLKSVKSSKTSVLKVTGFTADGTIQLKAMNKAGTAKLTVTTAAGAQKTVTVQVKEIATKKIKNVSKKLTLKKGESVTLEPVLQPLNSTQKITYKSSNKKVVTVSANGKLKAKKKGTATITVKSGSKSVKCKVTVKK